MGKTEFIRIPGLNIQHPWSELILSGKKLVETRGYPIPGKYRGKIMAIIETQGRSLSNTRRQAKIVGLVRFSTCFQYTSFSHWLDDNRRHCVDQDDPMFAYRGDMEKWGWEIDFTCKLNEPMAPPRRRGIRFAKACEIPVSNLCCSPTDVANLVKA